MSFSKSAIYTILTQIPAQIFGIISGLFITRVLGPSGRGVYAIFHADVSLFNTVFGFSITVAIIYFISSKKMTEAKIMGLSVITSVISMLLSLVTLFVWLNIPASDIFLPKENTTGGIILCFILFLLITQINTIYSGFFQGIKNFRAVNSILLVNSVLNLILYGGAYLLSRLNVMTVGIFEILVIGLIVLIMNMLQWHLNFTKYFSYKIDVKLHWKRDVRPFLDYIGIGHLSNIVSFLNFRLVLWVLAYHLDNYQVGIFSLAFGLTQILSFLSSPLAQVLLPFLSSENDSQRLITFTRFARVHFMMVMVIATAGALIAPIVVPSLYGAEFSESIVPFEIMIFAVAISCQTRIFAGFLLADNKVKVNLWSTIVGFLFTLIFNFILIKSYGVIGASLATSITFVGMFLFMYLSMVLFVKIPSKNLFFMTKTDLFYLKQKITRRNKNDEFS